MVRRDNLSRELEDKASRNVSRFATWSLLLLVSRAHAARTYLGDRRAWMVWVLRQSRASGRHLNFIGAMSAR
jgi:hypothetical protein